MMSRPFLVRGLVVCVVLLSGFARAQDRPNILVIWGDDVGQSNISAYTFGLVGYRTPNIDRIAKEGMMFTDYYGEQSCTAGRSSYIMGQSVFRTGSFESWSAGRQGRHAGRRSRPSRACLKEYGYATGQFGKNHLGDRDEHLPTNHGFDEFFGNLYHLNAEEEPENEDYPDMVLADGRTFREAFGPRGVIKSSADGEIEDTGPLTRKRMETVDEETLAAAIDFIERAHASGKPFYVWWNGTRMHFRTHVKEELRGISGQDEYADGMVEHDMHVGPAARHAGPARHRGQHDRALLHGQRPTHEFLARRRHDAVPRREEHQLGGRLARALDGALARQDRGRLGLQRDHAPHGLAADAAGGRRVPTTSRRSC